MITDKMIDMGASILSFKNKDLRLKRVWCGVRIKAQSQLLSCVFPFFEQDFLPELL